MTKKDAHELVKLRAAQRWVTFNVNIKSDHGLLLRAVRRDISVFGHVDNL